MAAKAALILIDFFNPLTLKDGSALAKAALKAAKKTAALKARLRRLRVPTIYANDNFGRWESEFSTLVKTCVELSGSPGEIARVLAPQPGDRSILKPRHSAFYGTPLEFLLEELHSETLILVGLAADSCITITAHDAHVRKFKVWIPNDCVAAEKPEYTRAALAHLRRNLRASIARSSVRASKEIARLQSARRSPAPS